MAIHGFEKASQDKEWTEDVIAFWGDVLFRWEGLVVSICGSAWIILYYGAGYVIPASVFLLAALVAFIIACFRAYNGARRARDKALNDLKAILDAQTAIPQLAGFWFTKFGGNVTITQEGRRIKSSFPHGSVDHFSEGVYDPVTRKIEIKTERVDIALPPANQRYVYPETWEYISDDRILYNCPRNFNGEHEIGILWRRTHG